MRKDYASHNRKPRDGRESDAGERRVGQIPDLQGAVASQGHDADHPAGEGSVGLQDGGAVQARLPVAGFLDTARWLLDRDCPYCQLATEALRRIQELGDEMAIYFLNRIQLAKANNDAEELRRIRQEIAAALRGEPVAVDGRR